MGYREEADGRSSRASAFRLAPIRPYPTIRGQCLFPTQRYRPVALSDGSEWVGGLISQYPRKASP